MPHCNQCDSDWTSRVERPVQCPRCKRVDWAQPRKSLSSEGENVSELKREVEDILRGVRKNAPEPEYCTHEQYNEVDGEDYRCGLPEHGMKVKHGNWVRV